MKRTISAYTTVRSAMEMDYPFRESINSMLQFADEVVVLDSTDRVDGDGTTEALEQMAKDDPRIHHEQVVLDWKAPNHGSLDGQAKAMSRAKCSGDFLWQFDTDEIMHETHAPMVQELIAKIDWSQTQLVALPVVEFWGHTGKVRIDVNLWKWRLSRNLPYITHGIPIHLRQRDTEGRLFAKHGTDGCDYIDKVTGQIIPCAGYVPEQVELLRRTAAQDPGPVSIVERFVNESLTQLPGVFHYSWFNIARKIQQYRIFWTGFWPAMYNESRDERSNPFFPGKLWSEVSDQEIKELASELETQTAGHIFHKPWDGFSTNGITVNMTHPKEIQSWVKKHQ